MINLLPPSIKKEQKIKKISQQTDGALLTIIIMLVMTFSAIYFIKYLLENQLSKNQKQLDTTIAEIAKLKDVEDKVNLVNLKIAKITKVDQSRTEWSELFLKINNAIPKKVMLKSLQVDKEKKSFTISAAAETRGDIVKLQAKLEEMDELKSLSFHSSNYDENNNYFTFSMEGTLE